MALQQPKKDYSQQQKTWTSSFKWVAPQKQPAFVLLPEGDYDFTVTKCERIEHTQSGESKIPSCPAAKMTLTVQSEQGETNIFKTYFLYDQELPAVNGRNKTWVPIAAMIEFLLAISFSEQKLKNERDEFVVPWGEIEGKTGRAHIIQKNYQGKTYNEVQRLK